MGFLARRGSTITVTLHPNMVLGETLRGHFNKELAEVSEALTNRVRALPDHPIRRVRLKFPPAPE